ncbi:redoxin [Saccharomonospora sp. CUA-673]|uniref:TlpA family protein disulfide reductase n=1 Tax=Saccharomonospora sp. CUA-673 TaxID=1904969 RepID=UPI00095F7F83|nr:redoxin family protein [Saccharomonospora sp. CUA-673]OLT41774.1 redoxin [Saccharomonospora sp. CUA-673]
MTTTDNLTAARTKRWRTIRWIALLIVAATVGLGAVFGSRLGQDPTLVDSPLIGKPASTRPLPYLEREGTLSLADLQGQVVVVNFWASWCTPCRAEHPALTAAADNYQAKGVTVVGVNYQDKRGAATAFLDELGRGDSRAYRYVTDPDSRLALDFGVFGIPETFFLDRSGTIVAKITGPVSHSLMSGTLDAILAGRQPRSHTEGTVQPGPGR